MSRLLSKTTELSLEISPEMNLLFWEKSRCHSTNHSSWRAYINRLTLEAFLSYLAGDQDFSASVWPSKDGACKLWELLNGSAINFGNKRLIILPGEAIDEDEFRIPQEWVDIQKLSADYYLAARVDVDEQLISIWGYATHAMVKTQGSYDFRDRHYSLAGKDLIPDLSVLWATCELFPEEQTREPVAPLPQLTPVVAENLIQRLGNKAIIEPRLEIPFATWGAFLEQDSWTHKLVNTRLGLKVNKPVNLSKWFEKTFEAGWQSIDSIFNSSYGTVRKSSSVVGGDYKNTIKRAKYIEINTENRVVLQIEISPQDRTHNKLIVRLHPQQGDRYLPDNMTMKMLYSNGETIYSAKTTSEVNLLKKEVQLGVGQCVTVKIALGEFKYSQDFLV